MLICYECEKELREEYFQRLKKENRNKYNQNLHHSRIKRKLINEDINNSDITKDSFFTENNSYRPNNKKLTISNKKEYNKKIN